MYTYSLMAAAGISFIFFMTVLGSATVLLFPVRKRAGLQNVMMGFAAGVMSAAAVWSLLLPAMEQTGQDGIFPIWLPAVSGLFLGAAFIACLELWQREQTDGSLLFTAVTLHNIPEGMAVGLAFALAAGGEGAAAAMALAFGIGVQNFPEGAAVSLPLHQAGMGRAAAFFKGFLSGAVEPVFALMAMAAAAYIYPAMPWLLSFSAGAMLYVSARELLPEAVGTAGSFGYIFGFVLMMWLDTALG